MKSEQLHRVREACKEQLLQALMTLVRENGVDYNDYFRDEHGIEEDEGYTIGKCFDIASFGCHMALPLKWCDDFENDREPTAEELADEFGYHAYWSLYIERDQTGYETLMLYQFYCPGVCWDSDEAEPDHSPASEMSLAELNYLTEAIYWHLRRDVEKVVEEEDKRLPMVELDDEQLSWVDRLNAMFMELEKAGIGMVLDYSLGQLTLTAFNQRNVIAVGEVGEIDGAGDEVDIEHLIDKGNVKCPYKLYNSAFSNLHAIVKKNDTERADQLVELYYQLTDAEKDRFLRETENG